MAALLATVGGNFSTRTHFRLTPPGSARTVERWSHVSCWEDDGDDDDDDDDHVYQEKDGSEAGGAVQMALKEITEMAEQGPETAEGIEVIFLSEIW